MGFVCAVVRDYRHMVSVDKVYGQRVDWGKSDSKLADEQTAAVEDTKKGANTPNNKAKKWFRDHRPKK